jgi:hypothetical protein
MVTAYIVMQMGTPSVVGAVWAFKREMKNLLSLERVRVALSNSYQSGV